MRISFTVSLPVLSPLCIPGKRRLICRYVEHGITGDVLAAMDHASLLDLGMTSVGHRLNLLRAVWELKRHQGLPIAEDEWQPQGVYVSLGMHSWLIHV